MPATHKNLKVTLRFWQLPTSGPDNNNVSGSFYNLLNQYGLTESVTGSAGGVNYNIAQAPLYFVRSGGIYLDNGSVGGPHFGYLSISGIWWSSRAYSTTNAGYYLYFNATDVFPSNYSNGFRYHGFSLRCLSTVV